MCHSKNRSVFLTLTCATKRHNTLKIIGEWTGDVRGIGVNALNISIMSNTQQWTHLLGCCCLPPASAKGVCTLFSPPTSALFSPTIIIPTIITFSTIIITHYLSGTRVIGPRWIRMRKSPLDSVTNVASLHSIKLQLVAKKTFLQCARPNFFCWHCRDIDQPFHWETIYKWLRREHITRLLGFQPTRRLSGQPRRPAADLRYWDSVAAQNFWLWLLKRTKAKSKNKSLTFSTNFEPRTKKWVDWLTTPPLSGWILLPPIPTFLPPSSRPPAVGN